jgi:hypothetical protein
MEDEIASEIEQAVATVRAARPLDPALAFTDLYSASRAPL